MSFTPNVEVARKRFVERVAIAYELTWHAHGYVGPEYTYEAAIEAAEVIARHSFPLPGQVVPRAPIYAGVVTAEFIPGYVNTIEVPSPDYDDGVAGD